MIESPVVIRTPFSKREAVEKLQSGITGTGVLGGRVSESKVVVWRGTSGSWPSPVPMFRGRFVSDRGQLALRGRFSSSWQDRLAMFAAVLLIALYVTDRSLVSILPALAAAVVLDVIVPHIAYADRRRDITGTLELLLAPPE